MPYGEYILASNGADVLEHIINTRNLSGQKCLFITTASEVREWGEKGRGECYQRELEIMKDMGLKVRTATLTRRSPSYVRNLAQRADILYACGGYPFKLRQRMVETDFVTTLKKAVEIDGKPVITDSAATVAMGNKMDLGYPERYFRKYHILPYQRTGFLVTQKSFAVHWKNPKYHGDYEKYPEGLNVPGVIKLKDNQYWLIDAQDERKITVKK